jgi:uncharacterized protein (TIGR02117 family)
MMRDGPKREQGLIRFFKTLALWAVVLAGLYAIAGAAGSMIPVNRDWRQAEAGVRIYVIDNGIHTDLVLPVSAAGDWWTDLVRPEHFADPGSIAASHVAFGWGDRDFYLNTPTWWDVNPLRIGRAATGVGATVMHVERVAEPRVGPDVRAIVLRPAEYARLAAFIRASFGKARAPVRGYGNADAFYDGLGRYSLFNTCNNWTGAALRSAGVRMGAWTPFPSGVMRWL